MSWPEHAGSDSGDDTPVDPDAFARVFETIDRVIEEAVAAGSEAFDRAVDESLLDPSTSAAPSWHRVRKYQGPV